MRLPFRRKFLLWLSVGYNVLLVLIAIILTANGLIHGSKDALPTLFLAVFGSCAVIFGTRIAWKAFSAVYKKELLQRQALILQFQGLDGKSVQLDISGDSKSLDREIEKLAHQDTV